jgi:hypothetical protein
MIANSEIPTQIGVGEFMDKTLGLSNEEFEKAMRLGNRDDSIDEIEIVAQPLDIYERS